MNSLPLRDVCVSFNKSPGIPRFEALFRYASLGILLVNHYGEIIMANDFALKEFGYLEEELIGKKIEQLIPQRFHKKHVGHRQAYSHNPQARPMGADLELFATRKDGTEFPVEISLSQYADGQDPFRNRIRQRYY